MEEVIKEELVQSGHFKYLHVHNELGMWPSIHVCMYHFCHVSHLFTQDHISYAIAIMGMSESHKAWLG